MPLLISKHVRLNREPSDGTRLLVMRYWPRGVGREQFDAWLRELAPSPELLRWCRAQEKRPDFDADAFAATWKARYVAEMFRQREPIGELRQRHEGGETITLLCACHDPDRCHRKLLADLIGGVEPMEASP